MALTQWTDLIPVNFVAATTAGGVGPALLGNAVATTILATAPVPFKCEVKRLVILIKGTSANATAGVYAFNKRILAGSDTGLVAMGTISKTASVSQQGKYLYETPATHVTAVEGDEFTLVVTTADGAANEFNAFVLIERIPGIPGDNTDMVAA